MDTGDGFFGERESSNLATNMANQIEKMAGSDVYCLNYQCACIDNLLNRSCSVRTRSE